MVRQLNYAKFSTSPLSFSLSLSLSLCGKQSLQHLTEKFFQRVERKIESERHGQIKKNFIKIAIKVFFQLMSTPPFP